MSFSLTAMDDVSASGQLNTFSTVKADALKPILSMLAERLSVELSEATATRAVWPSPIGAMWVIVTVVPGAAALAGTFQPGLPVVGTQYRVPFDPPKSSPPLAGRKASDSTDSSLSARSTAGGRLVSKSKRRTTSISDALASGSLAIEIG